MGKAWLETCKGCGSRELRLEDENKPTSWYWWCRRNNPRVTENKGCINKTSMEESSVKSNAKDEY